MAFFQWHSLYEWNKILEEFLLSQKYWKWNLMQHECHQAFGQLMYMCRLHPMGRMCLPKCILLSLSIWCCRHNLTRKTIFCPPGCQMIDWRWWNLASPGSLTKFLSQLYFVVSPSTKWQRYFLYFDLLKCKVNRLNIFSMLWYLPPRSGRDTFYTLICWSAKLIVWIYSACCDNDQLTWRS